MSELNKSESEIRQYKGKTSSNLRSTNLARVNGVLRGPKPDNFAPNDNNPMLPQISRTINNKSEGTYRPHDRAMLEKQGGVPNFMMLMNDMSSFDLDSQDAKHISSTKETRNTQSRSQKAGAHDFHNSNSYNNKSFDDIRADNMVSHNITPKKQRGQTTQEMSIDSNNSNKLASYSSLERISRPET